MTLLRDQLRSVFSAAALVVLLGSYASAADTGRAQRLAQCASCHGEDGNSQLANIPSLAAQPEFFLLNQLILMREGVRQVPVMTPLVKVLTDAEIEDLAKHFSSLPAKRSDEGLDAALVQRGAARAAELRCASCHLPSLTGQDQMPRLAQQRIDYMVAALKSFRDNTRSGADTLMTAAITGVSDADLEALAHYAASR